MNFSRVKEGNNGARRPDEHFLTLTVRHAYNALSGVTGEHATTKRVTERSCSRHEGQKKHV